MTTYNDPNENQGKQPDQMEGSTKIIGICLVALFLLGMIIVLLNAIGLLP